MKTKISLFAFFLYALSNVSYSQSETGMYSMTFVPQSNYFNPAIRPNTNFNAGLSVPVQLTIPFAYNDIFHKKENGIAVVNADQFYDNLKPSSYMSVEASPDISFGFHILKHAYLNFGVREVAQSGFKLSKNFFGLLINGNSGSDSSKNIGDFNLGGLHYREYSGGMSYDINCKWTVGGRLKIISGFQNITTNKSEIFLNTNQTNYNLNIKGEYILRTSGMTSDALEDYSNRPLKNTKNFGFGLDLGAIYKINKLFTISGSILDLGYIRWVEDNQIWSNKASTSVNFEGLEVEVTEGNELNYLQTVLDSIVGALQIQSSNTQDPYMTTLYTRGFFNFDYKPLSYLNFGMNFNIFARYRDFYPVLTAYANMQLKNILQFQFNYTITRNSFFNIGAGAAVNLGPVQFFGHSDNLYGVFFNPKNAREVNFRAGLNFLWSYGKKAELCPKPIYPDELRREEKKEERDSLSTSDTSETIIDTTPKPIYLINDIDGDGIIDSVDMCPQLEGSSKFKGCPTRKIMKERIHERKKYGHKEPVITKPKPSTESQEPQLDPDIYNPPYPNKKDPRIILPKEKSPSRFRFPEPTINTPSPRETPIPNNR